MPPSESSTATITPQWGNTPKSPSTAITFWGRLPLIYKIAAIPLFFALALALLQYFSWQSIEQLRFDARMVDVASRQRVLNERLQADVLLALAGSGQNANAVDWRKDITDFNTTADTLTNGDDLAIINIDSGEKGKVPSVPTDVMLKELVDQKAAMKEQEAVAEALIRSTPGSAQRADLLDQLARHNDSLATQTNTLTKAIGKYSTEKLDAARNLQQIAALIVGLLGLLVSVVLARQIVFPLERVVGRAREIGVGDLRGMPLPITSTDEIGELAVSFNVMQEGLRRVAGQAAAASESLAAAAAEILASAQEQAAGTGEQSAAVQETTTTMEEISRSGAQIADKARQVAASAETTSNVSESGLQAVQDASRVMGTIQQQAEVVAENVVSLSDRTRAIGDVIATVDEIAEQSHLLALNAAIEAAGAGEQGRRFSIVADEMKRLADQSREATVQVRAILGEIQKQIHTSVMLTEEAVKRIETGRRQSDTVEATIRRLSGGIIDSVNAFQQIVAATGQQQIGFEQVTQAAHQIRAAVDQATVGTRQLESAAVNVNTLSQELRRTIEEYQL